MKERNHSNVIFVMPGLHQQMVYFTMFHQSMKKKGPSHATFAHWGESDSRHRFQAYAKNLKC